MSAFTVGQGFDPLKAKKRKIFPVDNILANRALSDGPKLLYQFIYRMGETLDRKKYEWFGFVRVSHSYLSQCLGKSERGIRRDSAALEKAGYIKVTRPNMRDWNHYELIWRAEFDRTDVSCNAQDNRTDLASSPDGCDRLDRTDVSGLYKEDPLGNSLRDPSSSSSEVYGQVVELAKTKTTPSFQKIPEQPRKWEPEEIAGLCGLLQEFRPTRDTPDVGICLTIAKYVIDLDDARLWLLCNKNLLKNRNWGAFITDVRLWPQRREAAQALARMDAVAHRCHHGADSRHCGDCIAHQREEWEREQVLRREQTQKRTQPEPMPEWERAIIRHEEEVHAKQTDRLRVLQRNYQNVRTVAHALVVMESSFHGDTAERREATLKALEDGTHPAVKGVAA